MAEAQAQKPPEAGEGEKKKPAEQQKTDLGKITPVVIDAVINRKVGELNEKLLPVAKEEVERKYSLRYSELRNKEATEGLSKDEKDELGKYYDALSSNFKLAGKPEKNPDVMERLETKIGNELRAYQESDQYKRDIETEAKTQQPPPSQPPAETAAQLPAGISVKPTAGGVEITGPKAVELVKEAVAGHVNSLRTKGDERFKETGEVKAEDVAITAPETAVSMKIKAQEITDAETMSQILSAIGAKLKEKVGAAAAAGEMDWENSEFVFDENDNLAGMSVPKKETG